ncbi:Rieske 2Fe-2S domain-containing protein [Streptomyces sp. NPDC058045]|uniref:Rieske 2Fe-2S domain-containing protein n=1 Tax=Streptomyces sp. NPDC058045 TaxID=3346311 RepID=UPI0036E0D9FA
MPFLYDFARLLERSEALDAVARPLSALVSRAVRPRPVRDLLSGSHVGHPVHPPLTTLPIGAWGMAVLLDSAGGERSERAADLLVMVGIGAAVPTAAAGLNDWSNTVGAPRRVGLVHAAANVTALGLFAGSLWARCTGQRHRGRTLALSGLGALAAGGYLGGHLTYAEGTNVNRTAYESRPPQWTDALADAELAAGQHRRVAVDGVPVLLYRDGDSVLALSATCTHMGGPLDEGRISDGCVTCPWHGSTFSLTDGRVVHGPASVPQPGYETRVRDGRIEVRARG